MSCAPCKVFRARRQRQPGGTRAGKHNVCRTPAQIHKNTSFCQTSELRLLDTVEVRALKRSSFRASLKSRCAERQHGRCKETQTRA